jgi:lysophospholipase L1-like esterase
VNCSPGPDSSFPVGENAVVCTAVDSVGQTTCGFKVAVTLPARRLKHTKIMAFGDSITEGFLREPPEFTPALYRPKFLDPVNNYPYQLQEMLRQRYGNNEIVVINEGLGGETIEGGMERIVTEMEVHQPQLVLLLEGYNGLRETSISDARSGLRAIARWVQTHNADVVLATLFQVSDDREESRPGSQERIDDLNDAIRGLGSSLGLGGVADLEQAFGDGVGLLGIDGLHPNPTGYKRMAEVFRDEIVRRFEEIPSAQPPTSPSPATMGGRATSARRQLIQKSGH